MHILISTGDYSGHVYAKEFVQRFQKRYGFDVSWFGMGFSQLKEAGVDIVVDASKLQAHGLFEVIPQLTKLYRAFRTLIREAKKRRPVLALTFDFPEFHMKLGKVLRAEGIPVFQVVAPTVWAWRERRVHTLKKAFHHVFVIFPFEETFLQERGVPAQYIGHPLHDLVRVSQSRDEFLDMMGWDEGTFVLGLMPGSREQEVRRLFPVMLKAYELFRQHKPETRAFVIFSDSLPSTFVEKMKRFARLSDMFVFPPDDRYNAMANADLLFLCSGTVTLETVFVRTPALVLYKVHPLTWMIAKRIVHTPYISIPNILLRKRVLPELLQSEAQPERIVHEAMKLLEPDSLKNVFYNYEDVLNELGCEHAFDVLSHAVYEFLKKNDHVS